MDDLEKLNKIEYLKSYLSMGVAHEILTKMSNSVVDKMFKDLCKEYNVCNVCGSDLYRNGEIRIMDPYPSGMYSMVKVPTCPSDGCSYNRDLSDRLRRERDLHR